MIKLEIDEKLYKIPESFDELDFETYCKVFWKIDSLMDKSDDDAESFKKGVETESTIISRLMGEDDDFCLNLPVNIYSSILSRTKFLYDINFLKDNAVSGIIIDSKRYSIPPFNEMPLRQYIDADVVLKEKENPLQYIELLSILLTPKDKDGKWIKYNGSYDEMMGRLKKMSCSDVLPLVYHFFVKGEAYKKLSQAYMKVVESQQHQLTASS